MHRSELRHLSSCSDCGAEIRSDLGRAFAFGTRGVLCYACTVARGGRYDEARDTWTEEPRIDDLGPAFD